MTSRENVYASHSLTLSENCPSVFVSNDLIHLIKSPIQAKEDERNIKKAPQSLSLMRMDELLKHVKNYIMQHKLYDEKNPHKILLHHNALGSLLGKSELSLLDVRDVLGKFVFPVAHTHTQRAENSSEVICSVSDKICVSKRKPDNGDSDNSVKRFKGDNRENPSLPTPESACLSFSSDESMHSYQGYETEFVHDSLSTSADLIFAESYDVDVEYEIESDNGGKEFSCESDSDLEDFVKSAIISFIAQTDSDLEYLGDRSSDDESEKELSEEDKWQCTSCGKKSHPLMRCCSFCWRARAGWLPERSERQDEIDMRRKKREQSKKRKELGARSKRRKRKLPKMSNKNKIKGSSNHKLSLFDLSSAKTESLSSPSTSCNDNSDVLSQSSSNTLEVKINTRTELNREKQLCIFCCAKPADSTILHGKVACQVCCFSCGKKIFALNERCPVCRRSIERIVYLYNL